LIESRALRPDSCGAGKFRGGLGIDLRVRNLVEGKWNFEHARREHCPPWGIWGGTAAEAGGYLLRRPGEKTFTVMTGAHVPVPIGSAAIVRTGGGGGWGDPLDRDPALVQNDVAEGLISTAAARRYYGVALGRNLLIDENATRALRLRLRSARKATLKTGTRPVRKVGTRSAKIRGKVSNKFTGR
jgi:N-methylhydantoinase B